MFSSEFCQIFKNIHFFTEHQRWLLLSSKVLQIKMLKSCRNNIIY